MDREGEAITLIAPEDTLAWRKMQRELTSKPQLQPWPHDEMPLPARQNQRGDSLVSVNSAASPAANAGVKPEAKADVNSEVNPEVNRSARLDTRREPQLETRRTSRREVRRDVWPAGKREAGPEGKRESRREAEPLEAPRYDRPSQSSTRMYGRFEDAGRQPRRRPARRTDSAPSRSHAQTHRSRPR
jgi:hypothetical protein